MGARLRWFIVFLLFLGGGISYLDRAALSIAAPLIADDLGLDPARLGIVFSSFFFGYALFCFVGGWASDKIGPKNVFTLAMTVWSVFCGLTAAATSLAFLLVVRVVFGMGEGPFSATANKVVSNWFPRREQATAVGLANAGQPIGAALAGPVVGSIAVLAGWRISFVVIAVVGLAWVVAWMLLATDRPEQHRWLGAVEREEMEEERAKPPAVMARLPLSAYLCRPAILSTAFAFFGYAYILYFFLSWFPTYLVKAQGLSIGTMGVVNAIPWVIGCIGMVLGGMICDRLYQRTGNAVFARKLILVGSLAIAAICVALAGIVTGVYGVVALMAVSVFFMYLTANTYWAIILDTVEEGRVGSVGGFVHLIANLAGIVAPSVTGFMVEWSGSFAGAFVLTGAIAIVGALSVAVFVRAPADADQEPAFVPEPVAGAAWPRR